MTTQEKITLAIDVLNRAEEDLKLIDPKTPAANTIFIVNALTNIRVANATVQSLEREINGGGK